MYSLSTMTLNNAVNEYCIRIILYILSSPPISSSVELLIIQLYTNLYFGGMVEVVYGQHMH